MLKKSEGILTIVVCNPKDKKAEEKPSKEFAFFSLAFLESRAPLSETGRRGDGGRVAARVSLVSSFSFVTTGTLFWIFWAQGHARPADLMCFPFLSASAGSLSRARVYRSRVPERETTEWHLHERLFYAGELANSCRAACE